MNKILKIQNLTKNFGNVSAVSNVSIEVEEGTIHSIIGPNGAGKSTFFNMISGVIPPSEGNVYYKDKDITGFESYKLPHMGIAKCFQITNVFPKLTVRENVWASIFSCSHKSKIDLFKSMNDFETIDKYNLYGKVAYPKKHLPSQIPALYRWAASRGGVFVNPALTEPFGLTLLEASSCGLPIISTNDGGPKEIRSKCENGLLVDVTDINELKVILEKGILNNNLFKHLGIYL